MEGVTNYIYRNVHHRFYGRVGKYYAPFLSPGPTVGIGAKGLADVLPKNQADGLRLVPQILTNRAEDFVQTAVTLSEYGYREVNLNLGCPSGTVTAKKKGSGLLAEPDLLARLLDGIFEAGPVVRGEILVSVKTRIGRGSSDDWEELLELYNQYPICELTVHPRIQKDFYKGTPDWDAFQKAVEISRLPLVYNGDINTPEDLSRLTDRFPAIRNVMIGRGLVRNPQLAENLARLCTDVTEKSTAGPGAAAPDFHRLRAFHDELLAGYEPVMSGERNLLFRMKEMWSYLFASFPENKKLEKRIQKSSRLSEYNAAVNELFAQAGQGAV